MSSTTSKSSKSSKKSKEKPKFKTSLWVSTFISENNTEWEALFAKNLLADYNPLESWRGQLYIYSDCLVTKSKGKIYTKRYHLSQLYGLLAPFDNKKAFIIGILEENMMYIILRFDSIYAKERAIVEINLLKGPDKSERSLTNPTISEDFLTDEMQEISSVDRSNDRIDSPQRIPEIPDRHHWSDYNEIPELSEVRIQTSIPVGSTQSLHDQDADWDMEYSSGIMWIENTKYIDYVPSLGRNVQTDDGPIYMYCAHQVIPSMNGTYNNDSESESD